MKLARPLGSASPALLLAVLPKCPACLGATLAVATSLGLDRLSPGVLQAAMIGALASALALLGRAARRRRAHAAFAVACVGGAVLLAARLADADRWVVLAGLALLNAGALFIYVGKLLRRREPVCRSI